MYVKRDEFHLNSRFDSLDVSLESLSRSSVESVVIYTSRGCATINIDLPIISPR